MTTHPPPQSPEPADRAWFPALDHLPVRRDTAHARDATRGLLAGAPEGSRVVGVVGERAPGQAEAWHALGGAIALGLWATGTATGMTAGLCGLVALQLSAAVRAAGYEGLGVLIPRFPSWCLRVGRPGPETRYIVCVALDRVALLQRPRIALITALLIATIAAVAGARIPPLFGLGLPLVLLAGVAAWAIGAGASGRADPRGPEVRATVAALASLARARAHGRSDVTGILAASAAVRGAGILGVLDWCGADRARATLVWVSAGDRRERGGVSAPQQLVRAGWNVVEVEVPAGTSDGSAIDARWLIG